MASTLDANQDTLLDKLAKLKTEYFTDYHAQIDENRKFYDRKYDNNVVPATWRERLVPLKPQTSRRAIDEPADHILYVPHIKVPIRSTDSRHITERQIAEKKRLFLALWLGCLPAERSVSSEKG